MLIIKFDIGVVAAVARGQLTPATAAARESWPGHPRSLACLLPPAPGYSGDTARAPILNGEYPDNNGVINDHSANEKFLNKNDKPRFVKSFI